MLETLFILLTNLLKSFLSFLKIIIRSKFFLQKHTSKTKDCIVLGNGPSLKMVLANYKKELKTQTLICVNKFPDTEYFTQLQPRYYAIVSQEFWKPNNIVKDQTNRDNMIKSLLQKTSWPLTFYLPHQARSNPGFIKKIHANSNIEICYFNNTPVEGHPFFNNLFMRKGWGLPRPHNVLIPSIFNAINAGFKKIYLVGADHSWIPLISVNDENVAMVNQQHFYDEGETKSGYMHRNSRPRRLHEILEKFMLSFRSYFDLKDYAASRGVEIFNCTPNSFIDAFDRKDIEEVLGVNSKKENTFESKS